MTSPSPASSTTPPSAEGERILLLECRLEQARSALEDARADADRLRTRLAEAAARESDHARRYSTVHQELAEARAEIVSLHERLERSEALRAELEGHFFESGAREDADELLRLRREVLAQRDRCITSERAASRLRTRVDDLLQSREALLSRMAAWQRLIRQDGPEAVDLAEFMAELRRDILDLEHRTAAGERREAALRERLVRAGIDPGVKAADAPSATPVVVVSYHEPEEREPTHARVSRRTGDNLYLVQPIPEDAAAAEVPAQDDILPADEDDAVLAATIDAAVDDVLIEALIEEDRHVDAGAAAVGEEEDVAVVDEAVAGDVPPEAQHDAGGVPDHAIEAQPETGGPSDPAGNGQRDMLGAVPDRAVNAQHDADKVPDRAVNAQHDTGEGPDRAVNAQHDTGEGPDRAVNAQHDTGEGPDRAVNARQDTAAALEALDVAADDARAEAPGNVADERDAGEPASAGADGRVGAPGSAVAAAHDVAGNENARVPAEADAVGAPPVGGAAPDLTAADPDTRAAAYGRMVPLLEGDRLAEHLRAGLADPHPRVRRRTVLAAAAARSVALRPLLDPLRADPDPQVRRIVREVLRHATPAQLWSGARQETA